MKASLSFLFMTFEDDQTINVESYPTYLQLKHLAAGVLLLLHEYQIFGFFFIKLAVWSLHIIKEHIYIHIKGISYKVA